MQTIKHLKVSYIFSTAVKLKTLLLKNDCFKFSYRIRYNSHWNILYMLGTIKLDQNKKRMNWLCCLVRALRELHNLYIKLSS